MLEKTDRNNTIDFWDRFDQEQYNPTPPPRDPSIVPGIRIEIKTYRKRGRCSTGKKGCIIRIGVDGTEELLLTARYPTYRHLARALRDFRIGNKRIIPTYVTIAAKGKTFFATTG
jgi:hypothetical protein